MDLRYNKPLWTSYKALLQVNTYVRQRYVALQIMEQEAN